MNKFVKNIESLVPLSASTRETNPSNVNHHPVIPISDDEVASFLFTFWLNYSTEQRAFSLSFKGSLYRDGVLTKLAEMGYYKRQLDEIHFMLVHVQDNILTEVSPEVIRDDFYFSQLPENGPVLEVNYKGASIKITIEQQRECFLSQSNGIINKTFLEHLPTYSKPDLHDDRNTTYIPYSNTIAKITAAGIERISYKDLKEHCVWKDHIIDRKLSLTQEYDDGHYARFIANVAGSDVKKTAFRSAIGYLLNNYNNPSRGQAVMCYDEVPSAIGEPNGGTGKGLFSNGIKQMRNVLKVDGKKIRSDDRFRFQGITTRTQVFWIDDLNKEFPFEVLHSVSTDGWSIERKFKDEFFIPAEKGPKILLCSNIILSGGGSTNVRRQFILEFSDHYSKNITTGAEEPIKEEHGCIFFDNDYWDETEWSKFDSFMINCAVEYFSKGLQPYTQVGQEKSRLIQTTDESFVDWSNSFFQTLSPEYDLKALYEEYCIAAGETIVSFNQRTFNKWLKVLAGTKNWSYSTRKSSSRQYIAFKPKSDEVTSF